jgi:hypothetical protein
MSILPILRGYAHARKRAARGATAPAPRASHLLRPTEQGRPPRPVR